MLRNILLAAVAAATLVNGQGNPCTAKSRTVNTGEDLLALANCRILTGDLIIGPNMVTATIPNTIVGISGDLIAVNGVDLQELIAEGLTNIGGTFNLTGLTVLRRLKFSALQTVKEIYWQTLPGLQTLESWSPGVRTADSVTITDTILENLIGINLVTAARFDINNNRYLTELNVLLNNITDSLHVEANGPPGSGVAANFPNLTWANNATFRTCSSVSLPLLQTVNGSIGFFENTFESLSAPQLTGVGTGVDIGDVTFAKNDRLTNVTMPKLTTIGGTLQFVNNSILDNIDGFPKLTQVRGSIDLSGEFANATFPALKDVRGTFNLQTKDQFDCAPFDKAQSNGVIKGDYLCTGGATNPGTQGTTPDVQDGGSSSSGSGSGSGSKNAGGKLSATNSFAAIPALALFAVLFL